MSWLKRVFSSMSPSSFNPAMVQSNYNATLSSGFSGNPGLSSHKEWGSQNPDIPLEYVGIQGEYDPQGLAKRVAQRFEQHPLVKNIETLCILQNGARISLLGKIDDAVLLQQVIDLAKQVSGTKEVDVSQVVIERSLIKAR